MIKVGIILILFLCSFSCVAQDNCEVIVSQKIKLDRKSGDYTPLVEIGGCECVDFKLSIFDSYGNLVYKTQNYTGSWNPSQMEKGLYYCNIHIVFKSGEIFDKDSHVIKLLK
jgi:hypothetical protein